MKNKLIYFLTIILAFLSACTKNFEDINTNPNNPDQAPATNVFGYVIQNISGMYGTTEMENVGSYVGHVTNGTYTDDSRYNGAPSSVIWSGTLRTTLTNINSVIENASENNNDNMLGAAMTLKAYAFQMLVDVYGPVPYSEAGKADKGIINPKYDQEQDIYYAILSDLETANNLLIDDGAAGLLGEGDILYNGNITKWKKFCNSLRLRLAIRISNVDQSKASSVISTILGDATTNPIFESNNDNAQLSYSGGDWIEPWTARHSSIGDDFIAEPIVNTLINLNDPRLFYYAEPLADGVTYLGLPVGAEADIEYSRINDAFVNNPTGTVFFLKYSEVELIKAEAYERGFFTGDAQSAYEAGIRASCEEYGIDATIIDDYLLEAGVVYTSIDQIYTQKWIALFRQEWEAWAEMRRTDIPTLPTSVNAVQSGHNRPPFRFSYPDSERNLNSDNIPSNVTEDDHFWGYQIWWDTRTGVQ